jgi:hypothetical protein
VNDKRLRTYLVRWQHDGKTCDTEFKNVAYVHLFETLVAFVCADDGGLLYDAGFIRKDCVLCVAVQP